MKKVLLFTFAFMSSFALMAQVHVYQTLNWNYDLTADYPEDSTTIQEIDIDGDAIKDLRVTSWFGHTAGGTEGVIELLTLDNVYLAGLEVDMSNYMESCNTGTFQFGSVSGYLYTTDNLPVPYPNDYLKFPFKFMSSQMEYCATLFVDFSPTNIEIKGYAYNIVPGADCRCSDFGYLGIKETNLENVPFKYYTPSGQEIYEPNGVTLKVYETGHVERIFK